MREIDPFSANGSELPLHLFEYNRKIIEKYPENKEELPIVLLSPNVKSYRNKKE